MEFRSKDEFFSFVCRMLAVLLQHGLGGLLCIPAVLGFEGLAAAAARHGALSEAGWELSDTIQRLWQVTLGSARDRAENPPHLLAFIVVHHLMGLGMVIPINLSYGSSPVY